MTKRRLSQILQLSNDISEGMPLDHWKQKDFADCINYWRDELEAQIQKHLKFRGDILAALSKDL